MLTKIAKRHGAGTIAALLLLLATACEGPPVSPTQPAAAREPVTVIRFDVTPAPNLIQNSGFETVDVNGDPANWSKVWWGSKVPIYTYPVAGYSSARAVQVQFSANSSGGARYQPVSVAVTPGLTYTYTGWYNSDVPTEVDVEFTNANGSLSYGWLANPASTGRVWKQVVATLIIPSGVTKASVYHYISRKGTLQVDNVTFYSPAAPPTLPALSFSSSPGSITAGQASTLTWSSTNTTSCVASGGWSGNKTVSGSTVVAPTTTTTYTLACTGTGGIVTESATVTVTAAPTTFAQGMVTLSLDDAWLSQYQNALPILQAAGLKATFFLNTTPLVESWTGFMTPTMVLDITAKGHEIAGHTLTHPDLTTLSQAAVDSQIQVSRTYLQNLTGAPVTAFAYPYGFRNALVKSRMAPAGYTSARTVDLPGLNDLTADKYELRSMTTLSYQTLADVTSQVDLAKANKQWLILTIHEVNIGGDQYFITPARFQEIVNYIKQSGIKVVTIAQGRALMPN